MPNAEGRTPFALASVGGHLAVTRLLRQYAPAAGTPVSGEKQAQHLLRERSNWNAAVPDVLPRPHVDGWKAVG